MKTVPVGTSWIFMFFKCITKWKQAFCIMIIMLDSEISLHIQDNSVSFTPVASSLVRSWLQKAT